MTKETPIKKSPPQKKKDIAPNIYGIYVSSRPSGQIIIFHQPRFKGSPFPLLFTTILGGPKTRGEVAGIWPDQMNKFGD